jgi:raffinose/stachyose/melibiose transport system substrate-binding protein
MKKAFIFLGGALLIGVILGCSKQSSGGNVTKPVTLSLMSHHEYNEKLINLINERLDREASIEYLMVPYDQLENLMSTQLAAGEGPDIFTDAPSMLSRIRAGYVVDITDRDYLKPFNSAGFTICSMNGRIYGVPSYSWFLGLWYNKDLFEKAGVIPPKTFEELIDVCDKLKAAGIIPLGLNLSGGGDQGVHFLFSYLENDFYHGTGPGIQWDSDFAFGRTRMSDSKELYDQVIRWKILIDKGHINPDMLGISYEQNNADFIAGRVAMVDGGPWQYNEFKQAGLNFGLFPYMGSDPDEHYTGGGPSVSYVINTNSKNKEASDKVLRIIASKEGQQAILDKNPGSTSYYQGLVPEIPSEYDLIKDTLLKGNVAANWYRWSINMNGDTLYYEMIHQIQILISGNINVRQFLEAGDAKADAIRYRD